MASTPADAMLPEDRLLLMLVGEHRVSADALAEVADSVSWACFESLASEQLHPYLEDRLSAPSFCHAVPKAIMSAFRQARCANAFAHVRRRATLRRTLGILEDAEIPAIVVKGMALAHQVYRDPVLRPMVDMDLWVPKGELDRAESALLLWGFDRPPAITKGAPASGMPNVDWHRTTLDGDTAIMVELHSPPDSLELLAQARLANMWKRATVASLDGIEAHVLHPEDLLLHVCLHAAHHHLFLHGLRPFVDIALVLDQWCNVWAWESMAADYEKHGIDRWMRLTLGVASDLLHASVPEAFFGMVPENANDKRARALAREVVLGSRQHMLPPGLQSISAEVTTRGRLKWLGRRMTNHYRPPPGNGLPHALRAVTSHMWHDATVKVPRYFRLWRQGSIGRQAVRELALVVQKGHKVLELMEDRGSSA